MYNVALAKFAWDYGRAACRSADGVARAVPRWQTAAPAVVILVLVVLDVARRLAFAYCDISMDFSILGDVVNLIHDMDPMSHR